MTIKIDGRLDLKEGSTVAFDFDGVIHKYREEWKDGSIYDEPNRDIVELMKYLCSWGVPCVIMSTRNPEQIKEWWDKQNFGIEAEVLKPDKGEPVNTDNLFYTRTTVIGITNMKIPAQMYIDDRAYRYEGQHILKILCDLTIFEKDGEVHYVDTESE